MDEKQAGTGLRAIFKYAGAFVAWVIGAGFATGQEILQFFGAYGLDGLWGCLISMIIFAFFGGAIMQKGYDLQLKTHTQVFRYYCGPYIGRVLEFLTVLFLFCVVSIMIAGTGAVGSEYFGIPAEAGRVFMAVLCILSVL